MLGVELAADEVELFVFFEIAATLAFVGEQLFGEFTDLNLIVLGVEDLALEVLDLDAVALDFQ